MPPPDTSVPRAHRPFALLLGGGGARGFAHVGVLRALEGLGYRPGALVGVSMGAIVGATYALRDDWERALMTLDTSALPRPIQRRTDEELALRERLRLMLAYPRAASRLMRGWGAAETAAEAGETLIREVLGGRRLEEARIPVVISATDLRSGARVLLREGDAAAAAYASASLAGVLPPREHGDWLLADGGYADPAPVDAARALGLPVVVAVALGQARHAESVTNGYQAFLRATEIGHLQYSEKRFAEADLVLRPAFARTVHTLDFDARQDCAEAGEAAVHAHRTQLDALLALPDDAPAVHPDEAAERPPTFGSAVRHYWRRVAGPGF